MHYESHMKSNVQNILGLGIAICLGFTWACVKVDVLVTSPNVSTHSPPLDGHWISMPDLKALHKERLGENKCPSSSYRIIDGEKQRTRAWCWAASTRMVMDHQNKGLSKETAPQCNIVTNIIGTARGTLNCCDPNVPSRCIQGGWPHWVFDSYQFDFKLVHGALSDWDTVTGEICSTGPFISVIDWTEGGTHTLVITGYSTNKKGVPEAVTTYDPFTDDFQDLSFEEFVGGSTHRSNAFPRFSHNRTYVQIMPKTEGRP